MPAYCIANVEVHTPEIYDAYRKRTADTIQKYGGKFIVRGGATQVMEGAWKPYRLVVLEFHSMEALEKWYYSPEYQRIISGRNDGARSDVVFVEGFEP